MSVLASAGFGGGLLLFLLVCPLMMFFMMRGGHGHGGHGQTGDAQGGAGKSCHGGGEKERAAGHLRAGMSLDELKQERDELNALIGERAEQAVAARR